MVSPWLQCLAVCKYFKVSHDENLIKIVIVIIIITQYISHPTILLSTVSKTTLHQEHRFFKADSISNPDTQVFPESKTMKSLTNH